MEQNSSHLETLNLQIKNLENENTILRLKMQEQQKNGKFFNELYDMLGNAKDTQKNEDSHLEEVQELK